MESPVYPFQTREERVVGVLFSGALGGCGLLQVSLIKAYCEGNIDLLLRISGGFG